MPNCFVPGCSFSWRTHHPDTTLHVFPKKETRIKSWLDQLGFKEKEKNFLVPEILSCKKGKYRVCSLHFDDQDFLTRGTLRGLKNNAVPNQRLPPSRELIIDELSEHSYSKRPKLDTYEEHGTESTDEPEGASSSPSREVNPLEELQEPTTPTSESPPSENIILEDMEFENVSQESILQTTEKEEEEVNIESSNKKSLKRKKKKACPRNVHQRNKHGVLSWTKTQKYTNPKKHWCETKMYTSLIPESSMFNCHTMRNGNPASSFIMLSF